ncbi:hypothetical protein [Rhodococcus opacus]|uniref:hypothetical protein n=1 Tax=Rhodococcus opacus TaxID=37919 RepID=UPI0018E4CDF3|nr:hypothetical protein [Rhodococcus opacus]
MRDYPPNGWGAWYGPPPTRGVWRRGGRPADLAADPDPAVGKKLERLAAAVLPD